MGRPPCCDKTNVKKGPWTPEEDAKILAYVANHGIGNWTLVPQKAGLNRCGKSCRLRWTNYLRPDLKHDTFTPQEEEHILMLHKAVGSRWSFIAKQLQGRTDNDVKNHWNTKLSKKLSKMGIDPITHKPYSQIFSDIGNISGHPNTRNQITPFQNLNFFNTNNPNPPSIILKQDTLQIPSQFPNIPILTNPIINQPIENLGRFQIPNPPNESSSSSSSSSYSCYQTPNVQMVTPSSSSSSVWTDFLLAKDTKTEQMQNGIEQCDFQGSEINGSSLISEFEIKKSCETNSSASSCGDLDSFVETILNRDTEMQLEFPLPLDVYFDY